MNKQKLTFGLSLISLVLGSAIAFPVKTIAGQAVIQGTTPDSSGTSGDSFANPVTITTEVRTKLTGVFVGPKSRPGSVFLEVKQEIQIALNGVWTRISSQTDVSEGRAEAIELCNGRGRNHITIREKTQQKWISFGVKEEKINTLIIALSQIITVIQSANPGVPVADLSTDQLLASVKSIKASSKLAQASSDFATVDVNKVNESIEAYNKIVREVDPVTLQKLSEDPTFIEVGKILKEFRSVLV